MKTRFYRRGCLVCQKTRLYVDHNFAASNRAFSVVAVEGDEATGRVRVRCNECGSSWWEVLNRDTMKVEVQVIVAQNKLPEF